MFVIFMCILCIFDFVKCGVLTHVIEIPDYENYHCYYYYYPYFLAN